MELEEKATERRVALTKALLEGLRTLDVKADDYCDRANALRQLASEINNLDKIESEAATSLEQIRVDEEKAEEMRRANKQSEFLKRIEILASVLMGFFGLTSHIWMFRRSSRFEDENNAYLRKTDQTIVSEGLRGKFFNPFKK